MGQTPGYIEKQQLNEGLYSTSQDVLCLQAESVGVNYSCGEMNIVVAVLRYIQKTGKQREFAKLIDEESRIAFNDFYNKQITFEDKFDMSKPVMFIEHVKSVFEAGIRPVMKYVQKACDGCLRSWADTLQLVQIWNTIVLPKLQTDLDT